MRYRSLSAVGVLAVLMALLVAVPASGRLAPEGSQKAAHGSRTTDVYIVQLADAPAVAYEGGIAGYEATKVEKGQKLNRADRAVIRYAGYLDGKHADALAKVGGGEKIYDYRYSFNGFSAVLKPGQVAALRKLENVVSVSRDQAGQLDTSSTPAFLGLTKSAAQGGLWAKGIVGEDVIIGIVDSGVVPEAPSFSDQTDLSFRPGSSGKRSLAYDAPPSYWHGDCESGEQWSQDFCTNKLIGARYFLAGFGKFGIIHDDYKSPRDYDGHGSHTASTAGGNKDVPATGEAAVLGKISGIAHRARIAAYKVCWNGAAGGCFNSDSVAAIDTAVADGVDAINFSISGTSTNYLDPVEVAFLFARRAGVFVAASAGNSGDAPSTVAHVSPWLTSVAASSHNRAGNGSVTLGNGSTYTGASLAAAAGPAGLIMSTAAGVPGANATQVRLCYPGTLSSAVAGKIVVCDRGVIGRTDKSLAVKLAGGIGMVLTNTSALGVNADLHFVPTVHIEFGAAATAIKTYAATAGATAKINQSVLSYDAVPEQALFSSRGPSLGGGGDILKPDLTAPGVDVLAAVAPPGNNGRSFDLYSGTSMSSPHVAGLGALLTQAHRDWSPAAMQSALMTSTYQIAGSPFGQGAGHVDPNKAVDPGLVYDAGFDDYRAFLRSQGLCTQCGLRMPTPPAAVIDPSDLNLASIAIGDLAGVQTVTRTVTNVGAAGTYNVSVSAPAGVDVLVTPASLTLAAGEKKSYTVRFTRTTATFGEYVFGSLTWSDGPHSVRSPIALKPVGVAAPRAVTGTGTSGQFAYSIRSGFTGTMTFEARGLLAGTETAGTVVDDPTNNFDPANPTANQGIRVHDLVAPAVTTHARFSLFDENTDGEDDLDLFVYRVDPDGSDAGTDPDLVFVGTSGSGTSAEEVNVSGDDLVPGATYKVFVHGWQTDGPDASYTLYSWFLGAYGAGSNLTLPAPLAVTIGQSYPITVGYSGLTAAKRYLGTVRYLDGATQAGTTFVSVTS